MLAISRLLGFNASSSLTKDHANKAVSMYSLFHAPKLVSICLILFIVTLCGLTRFTYGSEISPPVQRNTANRYTFEDDVRPIMEHRCTICHGCFDAPCQLKLVSQEGIQRGGSTAKVYDGKRLEPQDPTRLYIDATSTQQWRNKGFHPVLNEAAQTLGANSEAGLMSRLLALKEQHPLPDVKVLPDTFDFSLRREQTCPTLDEFEEYEEDTPLWGMPFGLPRLPMKEYDIIQKWLKSGAVGGMLPPISQEAQHHVKHWEDYFNGTSLKQRLVARYLYEHLYLSHLYFEDEGKNTRWFRLIRSSTPPGQKVKPIATRRPFDKPETETFYYRLWPTPSSIVEKTHLPFLLNQQRQQKWDHWFFEPDYTVTQLPSYELQQAANPFHTFQTIPWNSRYRFLLDEAQHTIMNFIKGSVCRGSLALNVIRDRFWVFFVSPDVNNNGQGTNFLAEQGKSLILPASAGDESVLSLRHWHAYKEAEKSYLEAKGRFISTQDAQLKSLGINLIWDGGKNANRSAALTVFRHFDSASVSQGLIGPAPLTSWLIDYPILERIHYLLVAGYDVFGSVSHQMMTRLYMDFLRMESEMNFLALLPKEDRQVAIDRWYQDASSDALDYIKLYFAHNQLPALLSLNQGSAKTELLGQLRHYLSRVKDNPYHQLATAKLDQESLQAISHLEALRGQPASTLPETTLIKLKDGGVLTMLTNRAHTNLATMFDEQDRRLPSEDSLLLVNGILGAFPNAILEVNAAELPLLVSALMKVHDETSYQSILDRYGIRRTNPDFWRVIDVIQKQYDMDRPITGGIIDYNRFENR